MYTKNERSHANLADFADRLANGIFWKYYRLKTVKNIKNLQFESDDRPVVGVEDEERRNDDKKRQTKYIFGGIEQSIDVWKQKWC